MSFAEKVSKDFFNTLIDPGTKLLLGTLNDVLRQQAIRGYVVGGFVRDMLLHRDTADIDIAVSGDALEVAAKVAEALNGRYVPLDETNRVARVVISGDRTGTAGEEWQVDFATFTGSIEQDLARRDFTINAMAVDLAELLEDSGSLPLVDPYDGRGDLGRRVVRSLGEMVLEADPARLLRGFRLAAELDFIIDEDTEGQIQRQAGRIGLVASERIREELVRLLATPGSGHHLAAMDRVGLLTAIIPELAAAKAVEQPKEHLWNVFDHSIQTVIAVDFMLRQGTWDYAGEDVLATAPWSDELQRHLERNVGAGSNGVSLLKLAALLHDIAKPETRTIDETGRMRFLGHAQQGASVAAGILGRLRFSTKEIRLVETMVRYHLRPVQMSHEGLPSHRAIYRFFRDAGEAGIDTLFLSLADHLATGGSKLDPDGWREHTGIVDHVLARRFEEQSRPQPAKLVDGHDLISIFGITPGPGLGALLEAVREARAAGEVTTRQEALDYVRSRLSTEETE